MINFTHKNKLICNQAGASAVIVAITLTALIGFSALGVDLGFLYAERNRLQNAADAGALAGATILYDEDGKSIRTNAVITSKVLEVAANANNAPTATFAAQKGHYSFIGINGGTRGFSFPEDDPDTQGDESDPATPLDIWNFSTQELDGNPAHINAVQVTATMNAPSFFSKIWNYAGFQLSVEAVAYLGFAGSLEVDEVDFPIVICQQSILSSDGSVSCNTGRMSNSGKDPASHNTAGWTSYSQDPCNANANDIKNLFVNCKAGNPYILNLGGNIGTMGGEVDSVFSEMFDCWENNEALGNDVNGKPINPWSMTLLVVDCPGNNVGNCSKITGVIKIDLLWMIEKGFIQGANAFDEAPYKMGDWEYDPALPSTTVEINENEKRWNQFVKAFNLKDADGHPATYNKNYIYFIPSCSYINPTGGTGGQNYGIMAKYPVLVE